MNPIAHKIEHLSLLKTRLLADTESKKIALVRAWQENNWFTEEQIEFALRLIAEHFLDSSLLMSFCANYQFSNEMPKQIGIIMAGNLPLVGFHDFLCVYLSPHNMQLKLSSKDKVLFKWVLNELSQIDAELDNRVNICEQLKSYDAIIATGSDNSKRYFEYYFGKVPNILRNSRTSIAVLTGNESKEQLNLLMNDIFKYYGLGCRNVSMLFVPKGYDFVLFMEQSECFKHYFNHKKYMNNYDYNRTLLLMNSIPHLSNNFFMICEDEQLFSRIASVHYQFYDNMDEVKQYAAKNAEQIQCKIGEGSNLIPFGRAQEPDLNDFADNLDTMEFLNKI